MTLSERGAREVGGSLTDALIRLRRRRASIREQLGLLEAEDADLGRIEAAVIAAVELVKASAPIEPNPQRKAL
jgi:hypothetical protein